MKLANEGAEIWMPDGTAEAEALARTTHMAIVAHQDDAEIVAYRGILECFGSDDRWFTAVVVTNGAGSSRTGPYADCTDEEMVQIRKREQRMAGMVGEYSAVAQLGYTSAQVKQAGGSHLIGELADLLRATRPEVLFTHNLADKHDTHVAVALRAIDACRALDEGERPTRVLGGEVWRDLDWLCDADKVALDVQERESLALALIGVFDSQITGGKRYDLATLGRRRAHATYHQSHESDASTALSFAMDLTPLVEDRSIDVRAYTQGFIDRFAAEVSSRLARLGAG
jgi:LmbE family N-acetylglucosaminyl deacetylase